jgi:hypothetical protein
MASQASPALARPSWFSLRALRRRESPGLAAVACPKLLDDCALLRHVNENVVAAADQKDRDANPKDDRNQWHGRLLLLFRVGQ